MRKCFTAIIFILLFASVACGQFMPYPGPAVIPTGGGGGAWILVQKTGFQTCTSTSSCNLTISSTGTGNYGILMGHTNSAATISAISGGGSWAVPAGCSSNGGGSIGVSHCMYNLTLPSGLNSLTISLGSSVTSQWVFYEYQWTGGGAVILDNGSSGGVGVVSDSSASTSLAGVALTLGCSTNNCVIVQGIFTSGGNPSAITSPYTANFQHTSFTGQADSQNTSSGAAPTWTNSNSQTAIGSAIALQGGGGGGGPTWTLVQAQSNITCTSTTAATTHNCSVSVTPAAGHALIFASAIFDQAPTGNTPTFASATGDSGLTQCTGFYKSVFVSATNANAAVECAETTSSVGGIATFTFTWNTPGLSGTPTTYIDIVVAEVSKSSGSISVDNTANGNNGGANCTSCTGPSVSLTGSNDYIFQAAAFDNPTISGPGSPYTNPSVLDQADVTAGFVGAINQTTGAAITWTTTGATGYFLTGVIALK